MYTMCTKTRPKTLEKKPREAANLQSSQKISISNACETKIRMRNKYVMRTASTLYYEREGTLRAFPDSLKVFFSLIC